MVRSRGGRRVAWIVRTGHAFNLLARQVGALIQYVRRLGVRQLRLPQTRAAKVESVVRFSAVPKRIPRGMGVERQQAGGRPGQRPRAALISIMVARANLASKHGARNPVGYFF